jgi:hypothetical protein
MKNSNDTIGNQTRDLPTCSVVPQPTALLHAPFTITVHPNIFLIPEQKKEISMHHKI